MCMCGGNGDTSQPTGGGLTEYGPYSLEGGGEMLTQFCPRAHNPIPPSPSWDAPRASPNHQLSLTSHMICAATATVISCLLSAVHVEKDLNK
jgi:hypothetical protein